VTDQSPPFDECLCCGQKTPGPGKPVTVEGAPAALELLLALGYTVDALVTKHRAQLKHQQPGLVEWIEGRANH
jgi:hypothetical protein